MTRFKSFVRPAIAAALVAAFFAVAPHDTAQAQRTSLTDIDQKLDGVQDTLGPVPGPSDPDIQQQIDELKSLLCANPNTPLGIGCNKIVFVTSTSHNGSLGGLAGADTICDLRASEAGLPGTYMAWLSDSTGSPNTRFNKSTVPYVLVNGTPVATDYVDLTYGTLLAPINVLETGISLASALRVWTSTTRTGNLSDTRNCLDWSVGKDTQSTHPTGVTSVTDSNWTQQDVEGQCDSSLRLYCLQQ